MRAFEQPVESLPIGIESETASALIQRNKASLGACRAKLLKGI